MCIAICESAVSKYLQSRQRGAIYTRIVRPIKHSQSKRKLITEAAGSTKPERNLGIGIVSRAQVGHCAPEDIPNGAASCGIGGAFQSTIDPLYWRKLPLPRVFRDFAFGFRRSCISPHRKHASLPFFALSKPRFRRHWWSFCLCRVFTFPGMTRFSKFPGVSKSFENTDANEQQVVYATEHPKLPSSWFPICGTLFIQRSNLSMRATVKEHQVARTRCQKKKSNSPETWRTSKHFRCDRYISLLIYGRNSAIVFRLEARKNFKEDEQRMGEEKTSFSPWYTTVQCSYIRLVYEK